MQIDMIISLISSLISFFSVIIALYSIRLAFRFRTELGLSEQISNIPEFIREEYWFKQISPPISIGDEEISTLKDGRFYIYEKMKFADVNNFEEELNRFLDKTVNRKTWQNKIAYQISLGVDQVGLYVLSGGLPAQFVFAVSANQLMEDWLYCSRLVTDIFRDPHEIKPKPGITSDRIRFHRYHGEWIAYASTIYMNKYWDGEKIDIVIKLLGGIDDIKNMEKTIRKFAIHTGFVHQSTQKYLEREFGKV